MKVNQNILLVSDLVGMGTIASTAMSPILAYMGFSTYNLPTSLVSNNFGYGKYAMSDTTEYLRQTFPIWEKLGFSFSAIATGFIPSAEQAELISKFCTAQAASGARVFVDPVMGDLGEMYNGLPSDIADYMRRMLRVADLCYPNYTEACFLVDKPYKKEGESAADTRRMLDDIRSFGAKSVLITSMIVDGKPAVAGFNAADGEYFIIHYEELPLFFSGTGDLFSAILIGHILRGEGLEPATRKAVDGVYNLIRLNKDAGDPYKGIPVEKYLTIL